MAKKMKTRKSAAKRFSITATGKIKIKKTKMRHLLAKRSNSMKRKASKAGYVHTANMRNAKDCLPGAF